MASLTLKNVYKVFSEVIAVNNFSMDVKDKEFIVFVGPSGCGKTTTLRMIAGLESITSGEIYIGDRLVNFMEPKDRDIAMVFQNYALYPHMSVYKNLAFSLKMRKFPYQAKGIDKVQIAENKKRIKVLENELKEKGKGSVEIQSLSDRIGLLKKENEELAHTEKEITLYRHYTKQEIDEKVHEAAKMLEIEPYLLRKPKALSGGQRQRVAIGRAIVRNPKVFLMDEPLSNLDAKLRNQMRAELILLRKRINTTFVYVTHDQTEAMTLGDRIVIMKDGFVQQIGTPDDVFQHPNNLFVAGFIGTPQMNFFPGKFDGKKIVEIEGTKIGLPLETLEKYKENGVFEQEVILGIRPEHIKVCTKDSEHALKGEILVVESMGSMLHLHINVGETKNVIVIVPTIDMSKTQIDNLVAGKEIYINFAPSLVHIFSKKTTKNLLIKPVAEEGSVKDDVKENAAEEEQESKYGNL